MDAQLKVSPFWLRLIILVISNSLTFKVSLRCCGNMELPPPIQMFTGDDILEFKDIWLELPRTYEQSNFAEEKSSCCGFGSIKSNFTRYPVGIFEYSMFHKRVTVHTAGQGQTKIKKSVEVVIPFCAVLYFQKIRNKSVIGN